MTAQFENPLGSLGLAAWLNQTGQSQMSGHQSLVLAQQQSNMVLSGYNRYSALALTNSIRSDGDYWETREQRRIARAKEIAADARARHPEMQVKRLTRQVEK